MPHTNRKKKSSNAGDKKPLPKVVHTKRQQIDDEDGWTHVIDTPRNTKLQLKIKEGQVLHAGDFERDGVSYVTRTLEELRGDLEYYTKQWESGEGCEKLKELLVGKAKDGERMRVEDVVCLGLGSLQSSRREGRRASLTQLAALRTIIQALAGEEKLSCIFQDPQFTPLDKEFLSSLGYTVVEDPLAFGHITKKSCVYAIHCYADVYKVIAEGPRPAVVIGTDVENFGRFNLNENMESVRGKLEDMVQNCEAVDFPQLRHDFSDTKIYWRRTEKAIES